MHRVLFMTLRLTDLRYMQTEDRPLVSWQSYDPSAMQPLSPADVEILLLTTLKQLYSNEHGGADVRMGLLRVLLQVLQRHGMLAISIQCLFVS